MKNLAALMVALSLVVVTQATSSAEPRAETDSVEVEQTSDGATAPAVFQRPGRVCTRASDSTAGRCWELLKSRKRLAVVEAIVLENRTRRKKVNMHCSFTRSVSRTVEVGGSVTGSVKAGVFKVVEVNVSTTVHRNVQQTAEQASSAGGDVTLRPGESVVCQRTYGYVVARVRQITYSASVVTTRVLTAKVPSNLGVRITD